MARGPLSWSLVEQWYQKLSFELPSSWDSSSRSSSRGSGFGVPLPVCHPGGLSAQEQPRHSAGNSIVWKVDSDHRLPARLEAASVDRVNRMFLCFSAPTGQLLFGEGSHEQHQSGGKPELQAISQDDTQWHGQACWQGNQLDLDLGFIISITTVIFAICIPSPQHQIFSAYFKNLFLWCFLYFSDHASVEATSDSWLLHRARSFQLQRVFAPHVWQGCLGGWRPHPGFHHDNWWVIQIEFVNSPVKCAHSV